MQYRQIIALIDAEVVRLKRSRQRLISSQACIGSTQQRKLPSSSDSGLHKGARGKDGTCSSPKDVLQHHARGLHNG
jgi:hypothetical protein